MMSGGEGGVVKVAGAARRPSIRPKPVTPPRTASAPHHTGTWTLPPVRTPAPHRVVAKRPVLALVDQDESLDDVSALLPPLELEIAPWWKQPRAVALVVASVLAAAFTTTAVVWTAIARRDAAAAREVAREVGLEAVSTTTISSASLSLPAEPGAPATKTVAPRSSEPVVPVVDVNSLPPAPSRMASGNAR